MKKLRFSELKCLIQRTNENVTEQGLNSSLSDSRAPALNPNGRGFLNWALWARLLQARS